MKRIVLTVILVASSIGCDMKDENPYPHLDVCAPEDVRYMMVQPVKGQGILQINEVTYENGGSFALDIKYPYGGVGGMTLLSYCPRMGDVTFNFTIIPKPPSSDPEYDNEFVVWFHAPQFSDLRIWDNNGFDETGQHIYVGSTTNGDDSESFWVKIKWEQM